MSQSSGDHRAERRQADPRLGLVAAAGLAAAIGAIATWAVAGSGLAAQLVLGTGTLLCLALVGVVYAAISREGRRREAAEAQLQQANAELAAGVRARTAELEQQRAFLSAVIENMRDAIYVNRGDTVVFANRACLELLGASSPDQVLGRPPLSLYHPDDHERIMARIERLRSVAPSEPTIEVRVVRLDGRVLEVEGGAATFDNQGQRAILVVLRDVTGLKATEHALRQAQKMDAVGQLTGGIAHDFNNLLTVIIANLDLLAELCHDDAERRPLIDTALRGAMRGAELTRRLLAFARRQPLEPKVIDLSQRLPEIAEVLRRTLGEAIRVNTVLPPGLWLTRADPSQVDDALVNLALNARDAMPKGGELLIETRNAHLDETYAAQNPDATAGDYVMLSVTDSGAGMSPEVAERATEPFFTTKPTGQGIGLGLSMIYGFAKQSGGHLKLYSEPGIGTTVKLYLPRAETTAAIAADHAEAAAVPTGQEIILLVEDNTEVREVAGQQLTALGYRVLTAANGPEALAIIDSGRPIDLLFTDIVMPEGLTGYDLAKQARQRRPGLKVLFTTGYARAPNANGNGLAHGAHLLGKPYRRQELAGKIREALEAPAEEA